MFSQYEKMSTDGLIYLRVHTRRAADCERELGYERAANMLERRLDRINVELNKRGVK